jgi:hypothetical protein
MTTRAQLRQSARVAADQDNSDFPDDQAYNDFIDRAAARVWRRLLAAGWKPSRTLVTITATGASSYVLGTDVYTVESVYWAQGTNYRCPLARLKPEDMGSALSLTGPAFAYEITGGVTTPTAISLYPNAASGTYEVRYIPRFAGFLTDADPWYGPDGSDELIILTAAMDGAAKEDADLTSLNKRLMDRWAEVLDGAQWQDGQGQQLVRDACDKQGLGGWFGAFDFKAGEGWY